MIILLFSESLAMNMFSCPHQLEAEFPSHEHILRQRPSKGEHSLQPTKGISPLLKQERLTNAYCVREGINNLLFSAHRWALYSGNGYGGGTSRPQECPGAAAHPSVHGHSCSDHCSSREPLQGPRAGSTFSRACGGSPEAHLGLCLLPGDFLFTVLGKEWLAPPVRCAHLRKRHC